jgi:LysM repeat protein
MRKDVKLGFAIGGVLLAVVIVYVLVVSGGDNKTTQVALTTQDNTGAANQSAPPSDQTTDPFKSTPVAAPTTAPSNDSDKPHNDDKWAAALNTGRLPVMMTETPAPKSIAIADASQSTHQSDTIATPPITASNTPASVDSSERSPTSQPTDSRIHIVQSGETFSSIASAVYGSSAYYPHLIRANPTIDPRKLRAGMKITVPPISDVKADSAESSATSAAPTASSSNDTVDGKTEYRVVPGDTLSKISVKLFGRRGLADKIYQLNQSTIGPEPGRLKVGTILKLPEAPTTH